MGKEAGYCGKGVEGKSNDKEPASWGSEKRLSADHELRGVFPREKPMEWGVDKDHAVTHVIYEVMNVRLEVWILASSKGGKKRETNKLGKEKR